MMDLELLKEIPGYKAILKSVIKTQIQLLIEQLSDHTGEESIILTASINDGTLSHLGSNRGKGFLEGRDEIKSQFLGYCLQIPGPQARTSYQRDMSDSFHSDSSAPKRQKFHSDSVSSIQQTFGDQELTDYSVPVVPSVHNQVSNRAKVHPRRPPARPPARSSTSTTVTPVSDTYKTFSDSDTTAAIVKEEDLSDSQDTNYTSIEGSSAEPQSASSTQTQFDGGDRKAIKDSVPRTIESEDSSQHSSVKIEPIAEEDLELEITGVEMAGGAGTKTVGMHGDWEQNVSGEMGYQSSVMDESQDQSENQFNAFRVKNLPRSRSKPEDSIVYISSLKFYTCEFCGKYFPSQSHLERHVKIHTGQKDWPCQYCEKAFRRKDHLKSHLKSHASVIRSGKGS